MISSAYNKVFSCFDTPARFIKKTYRRHEDAANQVCEVAKIIMLPIAPFMPFSKSLLTAAMGARFFTPISLFCEGVANQDSKKKRQACIEGAFTTALFVGSFFAYSMTLGVLAIEQLSNDFKKATSKRERIEKNIDAIAQVLFIGTLVTGSAAVTSYWLAVQTANALYHAVSEKKKGKEIATIAYLGVATLYAFQFACLHAAMLAHKKQPQEKPQDKPIEPINNDPETPKVPEAPQIPEAPETPQIPETPEAPKVPQAPETPEVPETPEIPYSFLKYEELITAIKNEDIAAVLRIISQSPDMLYSNHWYSESQWSALHWAAKTGNAAITRILLDAGMNPNIEDMWGNTPMDIARAGRYFRTYGLLQARSRAWRYND